LFSGVPLPDPQLDNYGEPEQDVTCQSQAVRAKVRKQLWVVRGGGMSKTRPVVSLARHEGWITVKAFHNPASSTSIKPQDFKLQSLIYKSEKSVS